MIEEVEDVQPLENQSSAPIRRLEDLGTSENPIVIGVSLVNSRSSSVHIRGTCATGPSRLTSRRKCPLGAYVEIIDESRPSRPLQSNSARGLSTANAASVPPINLRGESVVSTSIDVQVASSNSESEINTASNSASTLSNSVASGSLCVPTSFEVLMKCSICMEIFYNPANVNPCNHKFCYSCLLSWKRTNQAAVCPQCRGPIHSMQKDALFNEVVQSFLTANPSKRRSAAELEALDAVESECSAFQDEGIRPRRRGSAPQPRNRTSRDRTIRTPFVVRVSQIRAHHSPLTVRQRGHRGIMEWFDI